MVKRVKEIALLFLLLANPLSVNASSYLTCGENESLCCDSKLSGVTSYTLTADAIEGCNPNWQNLFENASMFCARLVQKYEGSTVDASSCWCGDPDKPYDSGEWLYDCDNQVCAIDPSGTSASFPAFCSIAQSANDMVALLSTTAIILIIAAIVICIGILVCLRRVIKKYFFRKKWHPAKVTVVRPSEPNSKH